MPQPKGSLVPGFAPLLPAPRLLAVVSLSQVWLGKTASPLSSSTKGWFSITKTQLTRASSPVALALAPERVQAELSPTTTHCWIWPPPLPQGGQGGSCSHSKSAGGVCGASPPWELWWGGWAPLDKG